MMDGSEDRNKFTDRFDVSRETMDRLDRYECLLRKWNPAINLVAKSTIDGVWARHFTDSAQIFDYVDVQSGTWLDVGAGGGFPGLVLAAVAAETRPELRFVLVESDRRKSVFLQTVTRELSLSAEIISERIEDLECLDADILSARALAPLPDLLEFAKQHLKPSGTAVFLKGASFRREMEEALERWSFQADEYQSVTDANAAIIRLGEIKRV